MERPSWANEAHARELPARGDAAVAAGRADRHGDVRDHVIRLSDLASETKTLIETAVERFLDEVPALQQLKLVAGLDLRAKGDVQQYRVELPGPKVSKDIATDAKVRIEVQRSDFNTLATKGHVRDWREAFASGRAKATGIDQVIKLIVNVVERQEERSRTRKAKI